MQSRYLIAREEVRSLEIWHVFILSIITVFIHNYKSVRWS